MSENYFYSSLTGQEIEDTLLGAVVWNSEMELTTSQKARARANIGAGEGSTSFKIMGFFATLNDLREWLQMLPTAGDAYGISVEPDAVTELLSPDGTQTQFTLSESPWYITITEVGSGTVLSPVTDYTYINGVITFTTAPAAGTDTLEVAWSDETEPYNVYVWDGVTQSWIDNGALLSASIIDDNDTLTTKTWSSSKIDTELDAKQDTLGSGDISTAMLANGAVTRQKLANDALFSPCTPNISSAYSITANDLGYTLIVDSSNITITLTQAVMDALPKGAEIGIMGTLFTNLNLQITVPSGLGRINQDDEGKAFTTLKINSGYSMGVLKKTASNRIVFFGNAEVVS